jgi:hypothetical protein
MPRSIVTEPKVTDLWVHGSCRRQGISSQSTRGHRHIVSHFIGLRSANQTKWEINKKRERPVPQQVSQGKLHKQIMKRE